MTAEGSEDEIQSHRRTSYLRLRHLTQQINEAREAEHLSPLSKAEVLSEVLLSFTMLRDNAVMDAKYNLALATLSRPLNINRK